jgi:zinc transport system ATP-binding protein
VSFAYAGVPVLEKVGFSVPRGAFMLLIGPNGGGKTTLLRLMLGLLRPQRGSVEVLGGEPRRVSRAVGYVPQDVNLNKEFPISVEDVAALGCPPGKAGRKAAEEALRRAGMWDARRERIGRLSQGQRQRVLIARALALRPELLILDEPVSSLDKGGHAAVTSMIRELHKETTLVMVSHDFSVATEKADLIAFVDHGLHLHGPEDFQTDMLRMGLEISLGKCPVELMG